MSGPSIEMPVPTVRELDACHVVPAAGVLVRAMAANPTHVAVFGDAAARLEPQLHRLFEGLATLVLARGRLFGAWHGELLAGVVGALPPGTCRLSPRDLWHLAGGMIPPPPVALRLLRWQYTWWRRHPRQPHWHLGPFGVDPKRRGHTGLALARACARYLQTVPAPAYLETDTPRNVRLYRHFGFRVVGTGQVLGIPQWFMWRDRPSTANSFADDVPTMGSPWPTDAAPP